MTLPHALIAAGAGIVLFGMIGLIVHRSKDWRL
jgi:preprotein translocase subunit Sss1